jgi:translation initiation factor IF-2
MCVCLSLFTPVFQDPNRIDYKKVRDQFEVVPKPNFLINMGFVDRFKEERAVAAAQAAKAAEEAKAAEDEERKRLEEVERQRLAEEKKKKFMEESDSDSDDDDEEEEEAEGPKEGGGGDGSVANKSQGEGSAGKSQSGPEVVDLEAPFPPEKGLPKGPDEGSIASKNTKGSKGSKGSKNSKGSKGAETKGPKAKLKSSKVAIDGGDVEKGPAEG